MLLRSPDTNSESGDDEESECIMSDSAYILPTDSHSPIVVDATESTTQHTTDEDDESDYLGNDWQWNQYGNIITLMMTSRGLRKMIGIRVPMD